MGAEGCVVPPDGGGPVHERQRPQHGDAGVHHVHAAVVADLDLGAAVADQSAYRKMTNITTNVRDIGAARFSLVAC